MKKVIIVLLTINLILFGFAGKAHEIDQGSIMLLGDASFDNSSSKFSFSGTTGETDKTIFNLTGAYFVARNLGIGLMIGNEDSDFNDGVTRSNDAINMVGPMVNYNISLNYDTSLILNAGIIFASGDMDDGAGSSAKFHGDGTMLMVSLAYFVTDNIAINLGIRKIDIDLDITVATLPASAEMRERGATIGLAVLF